MGEMEEQKEEAKVKEGDSWEMAKTKIKDAIMRQTNKASAVFKLFMEMPQKDLPFCEWYPKIEKQADRVKWEEFGREDAIVLSILYQTNNSKLKSKILAAEEIDYSKTIRILGKGNYEGNLVQQYTKNIWDNLILRYQRYHM